MASRALQTGSRLFIVPLFILNNNVKLNAHDGSQLSTVHSQPQQHAGFALATALKFDRRENAQVA
jgi:hypothetical protein